MGRWERPGYRYCDRYALLKAIDAKATRQTVGIFMLPEQFNNLDLRGPSTYCTLACVF